MLVEVEKNYLILTLSNFSQNFFWVFLIFLIIIIAYRIFLIINSDFSYNDNDLLNFETEDEKKLYILTKIFTKINKNINYDIKLIADKGKNFINF